MALIQCPECSEDVSENAESCPGCGEPISGGSDDEFTASQGCAMIGCSVVSIGLLIFGLLLLSSVDNETGGPTASGAISVCQQFVKNRLKSPSSAEFPWGMDAEQVSEKQYRVQSYVEAQNSFGATLRKDFTCITRHKEGQTWDLVDLDVR